MKRLLAALTSVFATSSANSQAVQWPPLPINEYISGKAAVEEDVAAGRAVFVARKDGVQIGKPSAVLVPQYAWYLDKGRKVPAILIQAEDVGPRKLVGAKLTTGEYVAGFSSDFVLLGKNAPK